MHLNGLDESLICTFVFKRLNKNEPIVSRARQYLSKDKTIESLLFDDSNRAIEKLHGHGHLPVCSEIKKTEEGSLQRPLLGCSKRARSVGT